MICALCASLFALIFKHLNPFLKFVHFILSIFLEAVENLIYFFSLRFLASIAVFGKEFVGIANNLLFD